MTAELSLARTLMLACAIAFACARPGAAQELFGGYSYLRDPSNSVLQTNTETNSFPRGWLVGASAPLWRPWLSGSIEANGHSRTRTTLDGDVTISFFSIVAGPKVAARFGPLTEFGHVLLGLARGHGEAFGSSVTTTALALQPGGGIDVAVSRHFAARLELNYRTMSGSDEGRARAHQFVGGAALVYGR
jgi:hypothetical protein